MFSEQRFFENLRFIKSQLVDDVFFYFGVVVAVKAKKRDFGK
jgi:hypothetical protein